MNYDKDQIEDGILTTLASLHQDQGGPAKKIASYGGELDEDNLTQFIVSFPAILLAFAKSDYRPDAWPYMVEELTYSIIIGDRSMRADRSTARKGSSERTGTYELLKQVRGKLHASNLGLTILKCEIMRELALANTKTLSLYAAEYKVTQKVRLPIPA